LPKLSNPTFSVRNIDVSWNPLSLETLSISVDPRITLVSRPVHSKLHQKFHKIVEKRNLYVGELSDQRMNGVGSCFYEDGKKYEGEWLDNKIHGFGICKYRNSSQYEGSWKFGQRDGYGVVSEDNGALYEGEWKHDEMHGRGIFLYPEGTLYAGFWENNKRIGDGILINCDGRVYEGGWDDDMRHGLGLLISTYPDPYNYDGEFQKDKMHGIGTRSESDWTNIRDCIHQEDLEVFTLPKKSCEMICRKTQEGRWKKAIFILGRKWRSSSQMSFSKVVSTKVLTSQKTI
jgi:hypothetical protein